MRRIFAVPAVVLAVLAPVAGAQEIEQTAGRRPCPPPLTCPPVMPVGPDGQPLPPTAATGPNAPQTTTPDEGARGAALTSGQAAMPGFFGDLIGATGTRFVTFVGNSGTVFAGVMRVPSASRGGAFKVADGESPRPQDRVYYDFNSYSNVYATQNAASGQAFQFTRHIIGVEKAFFDGNASVGLRLPFVSVTGVPGLEDQQFADMSIVTKYAFINDPQGGRLWSAGLVVTVPTGRGFNVDLPNPATGVIDGSTSTTIVDVSLQPFVGVVRTLTPKLYGQGFLSVVVPTDSRDVTILTTDVGLGYWLYRSASDRFVQGVVPTAEVHVNTPLNKGPNSVPIGFAEQVNITDGVYVLLPRSTAGFAVCIPTVGPRPYTIEYAATYQFKF